MFEEPADNGWRENVSIELRHLATLVHHAQSITNLPWVEPRENLALEVPRRIALLDQRRKPAILQLRKQRIVEHDLPVLIEQEAVRPGEIVDLLHHHH